MTDRNRKRKIERGRQRELDRERNCKVSIRRIQYEQSIIFQGCNNIKRGSVVIKFQRKFLTVLKTKNGLC